MNRIYLQIFSHIQLVKIGIYIALLSYISRHYVHTTLLHNPAIITKDIVMRYFFKPFLSFSMIFLLGVSIYASSSSSSSGSRSNKTVNTQKVVNMAVVDTFVKKAAQGNLMEVVMGDSALNRAVSPQVRNFANTMIKDHGAAYQNLQSVAQTMGIKLPTIPGANYMNEIDALSKLTGNSFDKAYMNLMVKAHQLDLNAYQAAQKYLPAGPLRDYVESTIPVIQKHLQLAEPINAQLNK
jgi:putative membrane protein